jgi:serine/threonine-protein kinase
MPDLLRDQLQWTLGSAYTLERELGGGGMSRVFVAREEALGRDVVVKVLAPELAEGLSAERFTREIRLAARLQEPHILPVLAAGVTTNGLPYFTMPFVRGESLRARLSQGLLPLHEALGILRDVARALAYAHREGVVHRDIKPENVLLHEGTAVVADFGIAKALRAAGGGTMLTQVGMAVGSPAYMAPEQATGQDDVDHRADLYAWGLLAWETLAGRHPFADRATPMALIGAQLTQVPDPLGTLRTDVPPSVAALVASALAKDPAGRPVDADAIVHALDALAVSSASVADVVAAPRAKHSGQRAVAVLPLENLSRDPAQEFFSDGLTDALITDLAKVGALRVTSRTSAMRYKGARRSLPEIARELGVDVVLEGTVLRVGDEVRITVQLVDAAADAPLWAESYDRPLVNVLTLLGEVARAIASAVHATLTPQEVARLTRRTPVDPAVHEAYLRGRFLWNQRGTALRLAVEQFERAAAREPAYAPAHAGLADSYALLGFYGYEAPHEVMPRAKTAARRALALDDTLAEAHACLGYVATIYDWDWDGAGRSFDRALALNPSWDATYYWRASWLQAIGRPDDAVATTRRGLTVDPLSVYMQTHLGVALLHARRPDEAVARFEDTLSWAPGFWFARLGYTIALGAVGRVSDAAVQAQAAVEQSGRQSLTLSTLGQLAASMGDREAARVILAELEARRAVQYVPADHIAALHSVLGDVDAAFTWLERAFDERSPLAPFLAGGYYSSWTFGAFAADDPRLRRLVLRLGLPNVR